MCSNISKSVKKSDYGKANLLINVIVWFVTLITVIAVFVPFSPSMPEANLDSSWQFGINQAVAQGLSFGKDIIFTFGPYASIYTGSYHPATDFRMVSGSLYLALLFWICLIILMRGVQWYWILAFFLILPGVIYSRDTLLFLFPLLVGLVSFKGISLENEILFKSKLTPFYLALLFSPFGLLPLVKGTALILCGEIAVLCSIFFIVNRHSFLAIICLLSPLFTMCFFWVASGQTVANLPGYFFSMIPIVSGYTEAMALDGNNSEIVQYLITSIILLLVILIQTQITKNSKIFLFSIFFVFLFISFKAGFVLHESYHAYIAGASIVIASLLLPFIFNTQFNSLVIISALTVWLSINSNYITIAWQGITKYKKTYSSVWYGVKNRIKYRNWPIHKFDAAVVVLRKQASFPVLQGTTDIYSYNQSYVIASKNYWAPRPIFQSYSVYTSTLAEINKKHLIGKQAPDNIIFRIEPIRKRIPSIEDGISWPILMKGYQPIRMENDFLFLRKTENIDFINEPLILTSERHSFGERVFLPRTNQSIFAQIEIKPTILGYIATILFKPSELQITLELKNGIKKQYRIIAGMTKSGFLISPLIETTAEFGMLYGNTESLDGKRVKTITIAPRKGWFKFWNDEYTVIFSQVRKAAPIDTSKIYIFDQIDDDLSGSKVSIAEKCDGVIEAINGPAPFGGLLLIGSPTPVPANFSVSNYLLVSGWIATSVEKGTLPEAVYVVLTDKKGKHKFLRTRPIYRPNVGAYYNAPSLNNSGYSTSADISTLEGEYTVGLSYKISGEVQICPQIKVPVSITN